MDAFNFEARAELFGVPSRRPRGQTPITLRFARAAEAVRFAIEEMPAEFLPEALLTSGSQRLDCDGIRAVYENDSYPLGRRPAPYAA